MRFRLEGRHDLGLPIVDCAITHDAGWWKGSEPAPMLKLKALVDTGATHLVTTPDVVSRLALPFVRDMSNAVVGAVHSCRAFACQLTLFGRDTVTGGAMDSHTTDVLVLEQALSGYDVIIGWDVLRFYELSFQRDGTFAMLGH